MKPSLRVLIVDDELELRSSLSSILIHSFTDFDLQIQEASNGVESLSLFQQNASTSSSSFDLVFMDVRLPEMNGLEALTSIKTRDPSTFVVIITAHSNLEDAVYAIKEGAYDYIEKPIHPKKVKEIVRRFLEAREMVSDLVLSNPIFDDDVDSEFVGNSQKMREIFGLIHKLCKVDTTVLIRGENGTGKELVAKAIHYNSPRKSGAFIAINCGAIPENLLETEFFGHEKGAFTGAIERRIGKFQLANNGTLFLDEIGELRPNMQVKILRVLQEKKFNPIGGSREVKVNTRIVAATNRNLEKMIQDGLFREDLFYRLSVMPIFIPPLRERREDISALVQHFIRKIAKNHTQSLITGINPDALSLMEKYHWPGNIRELENAIERAFIIESTPYVSVHSLPESLISRDPSRNILPFPTSTHYKPNFPDSEAIQEPTQSPLKTYLSSPDPENLFSWAEYIESSEREFIVSALRSNRGRINQTVAQANIPKNTLLRKIKKYGINVKEFSK